MRAIARHGLSARGVVAAAILRPRLLSALSDEEPVHALAHHFTRRPHGRTELARDALRRILRARRLLCRRDLLVFDFVRQGGDARRRIDGDGKLWPALRPG